jgi:hypothetical protein
MTPFRGSVTSNNFVGGTLSHPGPEAGWGAVEMGDVRQMAFTEKVRHSCKLQFLFRKRDEEMEEKYAPSRQGRHKPWAWCKVTGTLIEGCGDRVIEEQVLEKRFSIVSECLSCL